MTGFRPPLFDNPATVGLFGDRSRTCFSSDCFGAPLPSSELAGGSDTHDIPRADLRAGQLLWAAVDSPWVHNVDRTRYLATVEPIRAMDPAAILSTHLPPAIGRTPELVEMLAAAPEADPFVGPDQRELEQLLAGFEPDGMATLAAVAGADFLQDASAVMQKASERRGRGRALATDISRRAPG